MQLLHGWREIADTFKVKQTTAKNWQGMGAPVLCLEEKPIAEAGELWAWLKATYGHGQAVRSVDEARKFAEANDLKQAGKERILQRMAARYTLLLTEVEAAYLVPHDLLRALYKAYWRLDAQCRALGMSCPRYPDALRGLTCGAKTRAGTPCKRKDLYSNGRCPLHGGLSTGPKTAQGKATSAKNGRTP